MNDLETRLQTLVDRASTGQPDLDRVIARGRVIRRRRRTVMVLAAVANGQSVITETIFENRYMHVQELARMGANIAIKVVGDDLLTLRVSVAHA